MNVAKVGEVQLGPLVRAAEAEGFGFVERLRLELAAGDFDGPGAALFGQFAGAVLVGVGGLIPDPYPDAEPDVGRLRHLYVLPHYRRQGIGKRLVAAVLAKAQQHYGVLRLRTDTPEAARFYEALGFYACSQPGATHRLELNRLELGCIAPQ